MMKIRNKKTMFKKCALGSIISTSVFAVIFGIILSIPGVHATEPIINDAHAESVMAKVRANAIWTCFNSTYFKSGPYLARDYKKLGTITTGKMDDDGVVRLPYLYGNSIADADLSCEQLIKGYHKNSQDFTGLAELGVGTVPTEGDTTAIDKFLQAVGYNVTETYEEGEVYSCYQLGYKVPKQNGATITEWIRPLCWKTKDGKITAKGSKPNAADDAMYITNGKNATSMYPDAMAFNASGNKIRIYFDASKLANSKYITTDKKRKICADGKPEGRGSSFTISVGDDWNDVMDKYDSMTTSSIEQHNRNSTSGFTYTYIHIFEDTAYCGLTIEGYGAHYDEYSGTWDDVVLGEIVHDEPRYWTQPIGDSVAVKEYNYGTSGGVKALTYFTGLTEFPTYSQSDRYWMYYRYFAEQRYFDALSVNGECTTSKPSGSYLQYYDTGTKETTYCPLDESILEKSRTKNVMSGVDNSSSYKGKIFGISKPINVTGGTFTYDIAALSVDDVLGELDAINLASYCGSDPDFPLCKATPIDCQSDPTLPGCNEIINPGPTNPEPGEPENVDPSLEEKCYAEAKSLGWIICPIIFGLRETTEHFYEGVEPLIMTNESIVSQLGDNGSGLYEAWAIFRGFANILFVIFFMVIIFSQLTGFGIDNYGIKRMLPKLIITALIVNLSFWICAIAVDASNIAGKSIKVLLEGIGNGIFSDFGGSSANAVGYMGNRVVGILTGTVTVGIIAGVSFALNGWAIIIPVLLFFLSVVIAVFFALIVLGMRQALVVILIVVAPLALVCMMLPNTEGIYKKWFSAAKGVLMVYPIAAAIIGAGYLTGSILMSADDGFIMTIVSGVLMVGPYFLIPSLTRKALDAVGNLGTRIGNFGRGLGNRATSSINNSEAAKNARADSREAMAGWRANRYLNSRRGRRTEEALRNGENVSTRRARRYARAQSLAQGRNKANLAAYDSMLDARDTGMKLDRMHGDGLAAQEFKQDMAAAETGLSDRRLLSDDGRRAWEAGLENKALEAAISDQSSLFENDGVFDNTAAFRRAVQSAAESNDIAKLQALMRKASNGSDEQRRAVREGMNAALGSGSVNARTAGSYASHIAGNGIYKSQDRSQHDQAQAISNAIANGTYDSGSAESFTTDHFAGNGIFKGKQASTAAFKFDDAEFDALAAKAASGSETEKQQIATFMQGALDAKANDTTGQYNDVKPETIGQIERVLRAAGAEPARNNIGSDSIRIVRDGEFNEGRNNGTINLPNPGNNRNNGQGPTIIT